MVAQNWKRKWRIVSAQALCILLCNLFRCRRESQTRQLQLVMVTYLNTTAHLGFLHIGIQKQFMACWLQHLLTNVQQRLPNFASVSDDMQRSAAITDLACEDRRTARLIYSMWTARFGWFKMTVWLRNVDLICDRCVLCTHNSASLGLFPSAPARVHSNCDIDIDYTCTRLQSYIVLSFSSLCTGCQFHIVTCL